MDTRDETGDSHRFLPGQKSVAVISFALLAACVGLCGCELGTDLRRAIVANEYLAQGNEYLASGDPRVIRLARFCFDRARELRSDDPEFSRLLVVRYVIVGEAQSSARLIVAGLAGKVDAGLRAQAEACVAGDQNAEIAFMRSILAQFSGDPELLMSCGMALFRRTTEPAARRRAEVLLDKAVELAPNDATVLNNVGYIYANAGVRLTEALALVRKADMLDPDQGYIVDSVGWAYFRRGMLREALPHLQRAARMSPRSAEIQYHVGTLYRHLGRRGEAQRHLEAALRLAPDYTPARIELDLCLELPRPVYG